MQNQIYFAQEGWKSRILNKLKDWKKSFNNQMAASAIIEAPAVMTAAGQKINRNGQVEYNHTDDLGVKQLRSNLQTIGEAAVAAPTLAGDVEATYQIVRHPVQTAKAVVKAGKEAVNAGKQLVQKGNTVTYFENKPKHVSEILNRMKNPHSMLTDEQNSRIVKYANSAKDPMLSLQSRLKDPKYVKMLKENNFYFDGDVKYFENQSIYNYSQEVIDKLTDQLLQMPQSKGIPRKTIENVVKQRYLKDIDSGNPFSITIAEPGKVGKPSGMVVIQDPYFYPEIPFTNTKQYSILKSHETSHALAVPKHIPPTYDAQIKTYFVKGNGAEQSARGTQIKNYFDKKKISAEELQYAAENYVKDTRRDNNMTDFFNIIRNKQNQKPQIWKQMAEWISNTSPITIPAIPLIKMENPQE